MKYLKFFLFFCFSLFLLYCSKQPNNPNSGSQTYRVFDSLGSPVAAAKVVLIEFAPAYSNGIRVDSGFTNNYGYISFSNLIAGKSYGTSATAGCHTSFVTWGVIIGNFSGDRRDTIGISIWPTGYMHIFNPLTNPALIWAGNPSTNFVINPNSSATVFLSRKPDTIQWAKFNTTTHNYEGTKFDTVIQITCGDTSNLTLHL